MSAFRAPTFRFKVTPAFVEQALAGVYGPEIQAEILASLQETQEDITYVRGANLEPYPYGPHRREDAP